MSQFQGGFRFKEGVKMAIAQVMQKVKSRAQRDAPIGRGVGSCNFAAAEPISAQAYKSTAN
jgi:hypothetical protein